MGHFFFIYDKTWVFWQQCGAMWNVNWVNNKALLVCFLSWFRYANSLKNDLIWKMAWYAITQAIWIAQNDIVFNWKSQDGKHIFQLIKVQVVWWMNEKWPHLNTSVSDLARMPNKGLKLTLNMSQRLLSVKNGSNQIKATANSTQMEHIVGILGSPTFQVF